MVDRRGQRAGHPGPCATPYSRFQAHKLRLEALERPRLALPLHDWNGADRIRRRTIDYLRTDSEVDERVPRFIHQAINTSCLEKNACFLTKHLFIFT
jgi:hypothetical protein